MLGDDLELGQGGPIILLMIRTTRVGRAVRGNVGIGQRWGTDLRLFFPC